jgi:AraC-like DNA-binding protein
MKEHSLAYAVWLLIEDTPFEKIASLSVSGLARKFGVKPSYLSRSFRKYYYVTLRDHLEFKKLISFWIVVSYMKNPQVKKALVIMNIRNTSHFIRRFKKMYKKTPGQVCREERESNKKYGRQYFKY